MSASSDRLPGSDSFGVIRETLADRLAVVEAQDRTAASTDFPAGR